MGQNEMTKKIRELKNLEALIEQAQQEAEQIKEEIKKEMEQNEVEEMQVDIFKVRYKTVNSTRFDTAAFKAKCNELYSQYTRVTTSKRFTIA